MPSPTYIYTRLACACQDAPGTPSVSRGSSRGGAGGDPSHQASRPSVRGSTVEALQFTCEPGLAVPRCQRAEFGRERLARRRHGRILTRRRGHKCRREQLLGGGAPDERELGFDLISALPRSGAQACNQSHSDAPSVAITLGARSCTSFSFRRGSSTRCTPDRCAAST